MSHIFISHSSKDDKYVRKLHDELHRRGIEAWIDSTIHTGQDWFDTVIEYLNSSAAVIVVMTPEAKQSRWVKKEILQAMDKEKNIYPLLLRGRNFPILIDLHYDDVTGGRMPPDRFFELLRQEVHSRKIPEGPTTSRSSKYSLMVEYENFRRERKLFAVDPRTIRIPEARGYPSTKHLSMCVAPTGTRIALKRSKISNLREVEQALAMYS